MHLVNAGRAVVLLTYKEQLLKFETNCPPWAEF